MASEKDWNMGVSCSLEESVYRRSTLLLNLEKLNLPIPEEGGIYAPNVTVFKTDECFDYNLFIAPQDVSVICASR